MEAIILAGGLGTRLRNLVADLPKPMAPVNGKPFLHYLLDWLASYQISRIVISSGYKHQLIIDHFGNTFGNIPLEYAVEDKPLGTGGAVVNSLKYINSDNVVIINGDTWFPVNLREFESRHNKHGHIFSIALKKMLDFSRYGSVETEGFDITGFREKRHTKEGLINGGIYLVQTDFFTSRKFPDVFSLEKDVMEKETGSPVLKGIVFDEPFIDIGIPEDYLRAGSVINL